MHWHPIRTRADLVEIEKVPLSDRLPADTTYDVIRLATEKFPERIALSFVMEGLPEEPSVDLTYTQLFGGINRTANLFHSLGVESDQAISFLLPNLPQSHLVLWGAEAAGIVAPINPLLEAKTIGAILAECEAKVLVTLGPNPQSNIWEKSCEAIALAPSLTHVLVIGNTDVPAEIHGVPVLGFDAAMAQQEARFLVSGRQIQGSDIAAYFHTGGTTGIPKIARHTHLNEVADAVVAGGVMGIDEETVLGCGLPLFHVNGVLMTGLLPFSFGAKVILMSPSGFRNPNIIKNFWKLIERFQIKFFFAVPTVYVALMQVPPGDADLSSLRYGICGAAPMPREVFHRFQEFAGIKILEGYGLTEATCSNAVNPPEGPPKIGSIGFSFPYQEMKTVILDASGNYVRDCDIDEQGVLVIWGPFNFAGYKRAELNPFIDGDWLNTGDLAYVDGDGYFWLTGRAKDIIIRGGHNIDPAAIEEVLSKHPAVAIAAAVGQPDAYAGELPVAFVQLKPGHEVDDEGLMTFAKEHIGERAAIPVKITQIETMPLTAVGKIFKPQLRCLAIEAVVKAEMAEKGIQADLSFKTDAARGNVLQIHSNQKEEIEAMMAAYAISWDFS